jgi:REP element-mobilizing transposase RayT
MTDHVHMMISIPPKYAVSQVVGFIGKGNPKDRYSRMLLKKSFGVTNEK